MIAVLGSRVLVLGESLKRYESDIIILDAISLDNQQPMRHGEIVHAGPDCENLKRGDVAMFHENAGHAIKIDEITYIIIHEDDVLAYSPNITEMHMAEDPQVKALREASDDLNRDIERAEKLADYLKKQMDPDDLPWDTTPEIKKIINDAAATGDKINRELTDNYEHGQHG